MKQIWNEMDGEGGGKLKKNKQTNKRKNYIYKINNSWCDYKTELYCVVWYDICEMNK